MGEGGIEPPRACAHAILSRGRLPIPTLARTAKVYMTSFLAARVSGRGERSSPPAFIMYNTAVSSKTLARIILLSLSATALVGLLVLLTFWWNGFVSFCISVMDGCPSWAWRSWELFAMNGWLLFALLCTFIATLVFWGSVRLFKTVGESFTGHKFFTPRRVGLAAITSVVLLVASSLTLIDTMDCWNLYSSNTSMIADRSVLPCFLLPVAVVALPISGAMTFILSFLVAYHLRKMSARSL